MLSETSSAATALPRSWPASILNRFRPDTRNVTSDSRFAFGVSLVWLLFYNARFWTDTVHAMWHGTAASAAFLVSLAAVAWSAQTLLLLLMPTRRLMIVSAGVLFLIAAVSSHFSLKYGAIMNKDMLRNVFETDPAESRDLLTLDLVARVAVLGLLPALYVWRIRLPSMHWSKRLRARAGAIVVALSVGSLALASTSASYAVFFREHKPIRFTLMPIAPVTSAIGLLLRKEQATSGPLINASGIAQRSAMPHARPLAIIVVVGETARAANFELGGYARPTNPELSASNGLVYFPATSSCGTSTAISVPCMFSHLPRAEFDVDAAPREANALDALVEAGLDVEWRDNNAGCKGVCARVPTIRYPHGSYDEVMLQTLARRLESLQQDTVIVLHQIGSHGPAYTERYPPEFEKFRPACHSNELHRCTAAEVTNAYDNTIVYTDHLLAQTIRLLRDASDQVDGLLIYASDHGESLGEQGLYLHGLPYSFAPKTQKHVPMLMWLSPEYAGRAGVALSCLQTHANSERSHDNLYHTLLGAADVRNASYDPQLDILAQCRASQWPGGHE